MLFKRDYDIYFAVALKVIDEEVLFHFQSCYYYAFGVVYRSADDSVCTALASICTKHYVQ